MDVDAIIARKPEVVLVDELAHTNIPGSKHRKRYEDVQELLAAKIDVVSTLNIQHIESIAPVVRSITGITVRETVPDWVPLTASETVMVDLTPEALQNRMKRGDVYSTEKVERSLKNFFRRGNLIALRELALRQVAEQVDRSLETLHGGSGHPQKLGRARTHGRVHFRESRRPISDCAQRPHGAPHGCGAIRHSCGPRIRPDESRIKTRWPPISVSPKISALKWCA